VEKYTLEITMESVVDAYKKRYIKRSFPTLPGPLSISRYGYPFSKYGKEDSIILREVSDINGYPALSLTFDGEDVLVGLNEFITVCREYEFMEYSASVKHFEVIHTTFYLYIE
jgi:hypothetical protein